MPYATYRCLEALHARGSKDDAWAAVRARLMWRDPEQAAEIMCGRDTQANEDIEKWHLIGLKKPPTR